MDVIDFLAPVLGWTLLLGFSLWWLVHAVRRLVDWFQSRTKRQAEACRRALVLSTAIDDVYQLAFAYAVDQDYVYCLDDEEELELTVWCTYPGRADEVAREVALVRGDVRKKEQA